jgi:hypothetical protein
MQNIAHLYALPIGTWQALSDLTTSSVEGIAQRELEGALHHVWLEQTTSQLTGAVMALFELEGARHPETGCYLWDCDNIKKFAADFCERSTTAQLATLAHTAKRAGEMVSTLLSILEEAAGDEWQERNVIYLDNPDGTRRNLYPDIPNA